MAAEGVSVAIAKRNRRDQRGGVGVALPIARTGSRLSPVHRDVLPGQYSGCKMAVTVKGYLRTESARHMSADEGPEI